MFPTGLLTISVHTEWLQILDLKRQKSQFEIVFKLLVRFNTQFRVHVKERFKLILAIQGNLTTWQ